MKINNKEIKGVIFDLDGVLVDTEYFHWQGWIEVLKPYAQSMTKKAYLKYAGKQGDAIESEIYVDFNLSLPKNALLEKKNELLIDWFETKPLACMPFAKEALEYFRDKHLKLACASGSFKQEAELKLKKTGLSSFFQSVVAGDDVERGKPYPDIYLLAAKKLGLKPEQCLSFEDTQSGLVSAKAAGLMCFAIPNEYSRKQDFSNADGVFANLKEAVTTLL
ncbi:MAG TPA: HAD family phosphatase [Patescibacteria group bacterium]|nr:HAD family phosphatase [Patescibacteria group bacterium]